MQRQVHARPCRPLHQPFVRYANRLNLHCRRATAQSFQPTLVSISSVEASGLHILEFVGEIAAGDPLCEASYLSFSGLPPAPAPTAPRRVLPTTAPYFPRLQPGTLELLDSPDFLPRAGLEALFHKVAFKQESAQVLCERLQQGACRVVWARSTANDLHWPGVPLVVGTAFAVLDGRGRATIWNVAVDPDWQQRGLGRALVHRLVHVLREQEGVARVALCSSEETLAFYARLGFRRSPDAPIFI